MTQNPEGSAGGCGWLVRRESATLLRPFTSPSLGPQVQSPRPAPVTGFVLPKWCQSAMQNQTRAQCPAVCEDLAQAGCGCVQHGHADRRDGVLRVPTVFPGLRHRARPPQMASSSRKKPQPSWMPQGNSTHLTETGTAHLECGFPMNHFPAAVKKCSFVYF